MVGLDMILARALRGRSIKSTHELSATRSEMNVYDKAISVNLCASYESRLFERIKTLQCKSVYYAEFVCTNFSSFNVLLLL